MATNSYDGPQSPGRSITIDRARKARIRSDEVILAATTHRGMGLMASAGLLLGLAGFVLGGWPTAAAMLPIGVLAPVVWWWLRANKTLRNGLDVGQTVEVGYADSGDMSITDVTGQLQLPQGSALLVVRYRGNVAVYTRDIAFVLPGELLTDADVAFLTDPAADPDAGPMQGPLLPLSTTVTAEQQQSLVSAGTRVVVTSADFYWPWLLAPILVGVPALVGSTSATLAATVCWLLISLPGLRSVPRVRARMRQAYRIGRVVRAAVTDEALFFELRRTRIIPWSSFSGLRVTDDAVILHKVRRLLRADSAMVLPVELFDAEALTTMRAVFTRT